MQHLQHLGRWLRSSPARPRAFKICTEASGIRASRWTARRPSLRILPIKPASKLPSRCLHACVWVARPACLRVHHQTFEHLSAKLAHDMCVLALWQALKSHLERVSWAPHAQQAPHAGLPDMSGGLGGSGRISSDSGAVRLYFVSYGQLWCFSSSPSSLSPLSHTHFRALSG